MVVGYVVVTGLTALANVIAAAVDFAHNRWVLGNMTELGIPTAWVVKLGWLKAAGALGVVVGIAVPALAIAAATGLVLFFLGALTSVFRVRAWRQLPYPTPMLTLAAGTLVLRLLTF